MADNLNITIEEISVNYNITVEESGDAKVFINETSNPIKIIITEYLTVDSGGSSGQNGINGQDGDSAYQVAVNNGFTGSESEWLTSLVGSNGAQGLQGIQGVAGVDGQDGYTPIKGVDYFDGVQGIAGTDGDQGIQGVAGADGYTPIKGVDYFDGVDGSQGIQGVAGVDGSNGQGVPIGGTTGQVLSKIDATDYNTQWVDSSTPNLSGLYFETIIWSEESGSLATGNYEYSYGNGATGSTIGIPSFWNCEAVGMVLNVKTMGASVQIHTTVNNVQIGSITSTTNNAVTDFATPVTVNKGDLINFITGTLVGSSTDARVGVVLRIPIISN